MLAGSDGRCAGDSVARGAPRSVFNQGPHVSKGYGTERARVDAQVTFAIPGGKAAEVYRYLRATYVDHDAFVKRHFPDRALKAEQRVDVSEFTDEYYDTPALDLFRAQDSVRYRRRFSETDPGDRKSGRELVQVKVTPRGHFDLRTELKFKVSRRMIRLRGSGVEVPLILLVKQALRADFKDALARLGYDPFSLRPVLTNHQKRSRLYLDWADGTSFLSFSVDEYDSRMLWAKATASSIDIGLQENDFTAADEPTRRRLWGMRQAIIDDLKRQFPYLSESSDEKYAVLLSQIERQVPLLPLWLRLGIR